MPPELEVLDQLIGGDLPLNAIAGLFPDRDHCHQALTAMLKSGEINILDGSGQLVPAWRFRELQGTEDLWSEGTPYRLSITEVGAKRIT
jgi:hypothetical protein